MRSRVHEFVVGRDAELEAVERLFDRIAGGAVGALVLEGEPGIGKTTVWREALVRAEARQMRVLAARTAEAETMLAYTTLADLVAPWYETVRGVLSRPQVHALDVALLRSEADVAVDPRAAGTGIVRVLAELAGEAPVVVAIDDAQWVDRTTGRVLEFAARRFPARVGVLVTHRLDGNGELPLGLVDALPAGSVERVTVGPLGMAALFHVIRTQLGFAPSRPVLARIASASGGNPFYALEIARALAGGSWKLGDEGAVPVPEALRRLVLARVRRLSPTGQQAALAIAALSRPTVPLVAAALGSVSETEAAILEAEEAGVVVVDGEGLRLAHPLLGSAVYASASQTRRRQLHRLLANVVSDPEERARHVALGERGTNEAAAAQVEEAAGRAERRGSPDAAAELYAAAARITPDDRHDEFARRVLGQAAALLSAGDPDGARAAAEAALARAETPALQAEAHLTLGEVAWVGSPGRRPLEHLERALAEAADTPQLRGRIHAKLVNFSLGDHTRAADHADAAIAFLDADADPALYAHALIDKVFFDAQAGRGARPDLLERAFELEDRAGPDVERNPVALIWLINMDEFELGRKRHAIEDQWYRDRGEEVWRAERLAQRARLEFYAGEWDFAERSIAESWATLEQIGTRVGPWAAPARVRALVDVHRGRTARPLAELPALVAASERSGNRFFAGLLLAELSFAQLSSEDAEAADRSYLRMQEHFQAIGVVDATGARTEPDHVEALLALGDLERARAVLGHLERRGQLIPRPWITIALPRVRALILAAEGKVDAALTAGADLDAAAAARVPFEHARTLLVRGRILRRAKKRRAAADTLNEAQRLFERLGAPPWIERTRNELGRIGLRPAAPDELTASELRVAELAAAGMTNREVAAAAFMSPKTVEANLARAYRKLGIRSRAELGARMAERRH